MKPFFIDWGNSQHPSINLKDNAVNLVAFEAEVPSEAAKQSLSEEYQKIGISEKTVKIIVGENERLWITLEGRNGNKIRL